MCCDFISIKKWFLAQQIFHSSAVCRLESKFDHINSNYPTDFVLLLDLSFFSLRRSLRQKSRLLVKTFNRLSYKSLGFSRILLLLWVIPWTKFIWNFQDKFLKINYNTDHSFVLKDRRLFEASIQKLGCRMPESKFVSTLLQEIWFFFWT
jgi:hypothetical protein